MDIPESFREGQTVPIGVLEHARTLADGAVAGGMAMDFDTALGYAQALERANRMPVVPLLQREPSLTSMTPDEVYWLAEALDIALQFDPDEERRWGAASIVADLARSTIYLPSSDAQARSAILSGVLGVTTGSTAEITRQIVDRYFEGNIDDGRFALEAITERCRTTPTNQ